MKSKVLRTIDICRGTSEPCYWSWSFTGPHVEIDLLQEHSITIKWKFSMKMGHNMKQEDENDFIIRC